MAVVFKLLDDGAFVVGDTETRRTAYAYPSSYYASRAKRARYGGARIAADMVKGENAWPDRPNREDFDARNWARLS